MLRLYLPLALVAALFMALAVMPGQGLAQEDPPPSEPTPPPEEQPPAPEDPPAPDGEPPAKPDPAAADPVAADPSGTEGDAGKEKEPGKPGNGNGSNKAPEGGEFRIGTGGSAEFGFADGTSIKASEKSVAKIQREQKKGVIWNYVSLEAGTFDVKAEAGPVEYNLQGLNLMGIGTEFQAKLLAGPPVSVEIVNKGGAPLVVVDTLTDREIRIDPGQSLSAKIDKNAGTITFGPLPEATGPKGSFREEIEKAIVSSPPTEMMDYRYTVDTGEDGQADIVMHDGGKAFVKKGTRMSFWSGKDKDSKKTSGAKLEKGQASFDVGTGEFVYESETVSINARGSVFTAEVGDGYDEYRNLSGEQILVKSKVEGASKDLAAELKEGMGLRVLHAPGQPGVTFEIPKDSKGETRFLTPKGKQFFTKPETTLEFSGSDNLVTATFPVEKRVFTATFPLEELASGSTMNPLAGAGSAIDKAKNPSS